LEFLQEKENEESGRSASGGNAAVLFFLFSLVPQAIN
jgi:hypothetical protein